VLTVVQHQQQTPLLEAGDKRVPQRAARLLVHPECGGDGLRHQSGVDQRRQFDQPDAIGVVGQHCLSQRQRQTSLANATGSAERQQTSVEEQAAQLA
jgi:hypothetical protein